MTRENQDTLRQISDYQNLIKLDPSQTKNYNILGDILINAGDLDSAIQCYEEAIKNTKTWFFYNKLSEILIKKQDFYEASIQLNLSLKLNSHPNWWTNYLLGEVFLRIGCPDIAIKYYQESIGIEATVNAYRALSAVYLLQKKWSDACHLYSQIQYLYPEENFWGICNQYCTEKLIALTYDDGPNANFTLPLLKILDKYTINATFFVIGKRLEKYSEIAKSILLQKHELGNHSYSHINLSLEPHKTTEEIEKTQLILKQLGVKDIINFRPPFGKCSRELFEYICEKKIPLILWSIFSADYLAENSSQMIANKVINKVKPGSIILLHDNNLRTLEATELIIQNLLSQGYRFVTVQELINQDIAN